MRYDGAVIVGIGDTLDRALIGWAADEAAARHAPLLVCHVWEPGELHQAGPGAPEPARSAEQLVREAAGMAHTWFPDLAVSTAVGQGRAVPALLRASLDARMVVLGARGDGGFAGRQLGSVAEQVATRAHCPVAVVRPLTTPEATDVVVGVDGAAHSEVTLRAAAGQAHRLDGRLIVVHGYRLPPPAEYGPNAGVDEPHHRADAEDLLERLIEQLGPDRDELKIESRAVHGNPAEALLDAAAEAAVLVVGARGPGGFTGLITGSVGQHVLRHARCPVLVVH